MLTWLFALAITKLRYSVPSVCCLSVCDICNVVVAKRCTAS